MRESRSLAPIAPHEVANEVVELRGRMRRTGATCAAAKTHARSYDVEAYEWRNNGAAPLIRVATFPSEWRAALRNVF